MPNHRCGTPRSHGEKRNGKPQLSGGWSIMCLHRLATTCVFCQVGSTHDRRVLQCGWEILELNRGSEVWTSENHRTLADFQLVLEKLDLWSRIKGQFWANWIHAFWLVCCRSWLLICPSFWLVSSHRPGTHWWLYTQSYLAKIPSYRNDRRSDHMFRPYQQYQSNWNPPRILVAGS